MVIKSVTEAPIIANGSIILFSWILSNPATTLKQQLILYYSI